MKIRTGALLGIASAAVALAAAHLVAAFAGRESSPVVAVGSASIDLAPAWLKSFAIRSFGEQDKLVLLIGIAAVVAVIAVVLGTSSVERPTIGLGGIAALALVGAMAALSRPAATTIAALPAILGAAAGSAAFLMLHRRLEPAGPADQADPGSGEGTGPVAGEPEPVGRRRFLVAGGVALGLAAATGVVGQYLSRRRQADASRSALRLPSPVSPSASASAGTDFGLDGLSAFYTPNDEFYRVDTALIVPSVPAEEWSLRVHGMVDRELTLDFGQLTARPLMERDVTLACVSNEVGGSYVGNARWVGVSLADVLDEAGPDPAATQLVSKSADGFTAGTPVSAVTDGRDAMLAVAMNGEPLPIEHGFPVRMIVPGLYGYVSATKWLVDLELTTFEAFDPYWIRRGWAERAPIKTQSRIDTPKQMASVPAGEVTIAGVAWAQHRGIERVEVRVDDGEWREAELSTEATIDTWRQWRLSVPLEAGSHRLEVRATDGEGEVQTADRAEPFPDGATGWHAIVIQVG